MKRTNYFIFSLASARSSPDELYARELAAFAGTAHQSVLLNTEEMAAASVRDRVLEAVDSPPAYWGDMWPSMYLLFRRIKERFIVALSGEGADELFGVTGGFITLQPLQRRLSHGSRLDLQDTLAVRGCLTKGL